MSNKWNWGPGYLPGPCLDDSKFQKGIIMIKFIVNAFSLNMIGSFPATFTVEEFSTDKAREYARGVPSGVGHPDTAAVFTSVLGMPVPMNRATVSLVPGDRVLVGQYSGPRLPEGAVALPEGATIKWLVVSVLSGVRERDDCFRDPFSTVMS